MTYHRRGGRSAMGEIAAAATTSLPSFEEGTRDQKYEHGETWGIANSPHKVLDALKRLKAIAPTMAEPYSGSPGKIPEEGPFIQGLKAFWVRMGRVNELWPGARGEFNFGPNTNGSSDLRINRVLYDLLRAPGTMWRRQADGFVRLAANDHLYANDVRNRLIAGKYLDRSMPVSTKDDSAMVRAIRRWYDEATERGVNVGAWPSGFNFGPNTNGDEVRISDELLTNILTQPSPAQREAVAGTRFRPPIYGTLTSSAPRLNLASVALIRRPLIAVPTLTLPKK